MNHEMVDRIAQAVLYEGYILYPYRPSVKNRQRWTIGGLYPQAYSDAQGGVDNWMMQTECLIIARPGAALEVKVRFLHLIDRTVGQLLHPLDDLLADGDPAFHLVESLCIGGKRYHAWQEAAERVVISNPADLSELADQPRRRNFDFAGRRELEPLRNEAGKVIGLLIREQQAVEGSVELSAERKADNLFKVTVRVLNRTPFRPGDSAGRDEALMRSLVSAYIILGVSRGEFVSLMDPPEQWQQAAAECRNLGAWPVLVGNEGEKGTMLASPIILYDYPQIAPESPQDLFDATEIDEILTLRIMTLTDEEKREMAAVDERASALLERTEAMAREQFVRLHGAVRGLSPVSPAPEESP